MPDTRKVIVTHHAPDLDAIGAVWLLKRFDGENYATAKIAFVNPGERISLQNAQKLGAQLHEVTHVDTGLGRFDHHQPENGQKHISATSLVYDYICSLYPEKSDDAALQKLVEFVTDIDHFAEVSWPESGTYRENFMLYNVIHGLEYLDMHDDDSQMHFGLISLDSAYAMLTSHISAEQSIKENGQVLIDSNGQKCLAIESRNDDTIKIAQKQGFSLVVRKDPKAGHMRIKARPDTKIDLSELHKKIIEKDQKGTWYFHPSGKMLINGSKKHHNQVPTPLTLEDVVDMILTLYAYKPKNDN